MSTIRLTENESRLAHFASGRFATAVCADLCDLQLPGGSQHMERLSFALEMITGSRAKFLGKDSSPVLFSLLVAKERRTFKVVQLACLKAAALYYNSGLGVDSQDLDTAGIVFSGIIYALAHKRPLTEEAWSVIQTTIPFDKNSNELDAIERMRRFWNVLGIDTDDAGEPLLWEYTFPTGTDV